MSDLNIKSREYLLPEDLFRFLQNRSAEIPNFSMLLGAGCSVSSGIKSATQLVATWKRELFESYNKKNSQNSDDSSIDSFLKEKGKWPENENELYSYFFKERYPLETQRINFIENQIDKDNVCPSIGYACLVELANKKYIDTFFTTNFDDLLNEAFYIYANERHRPIVCSQDSSINSISLASSRVKIVKLHGDYIYGGMKITADQTEQLPKITKEKLKEFAKERGLIVVGYSGNDNSIMFSIKEIAAMEDSNYCHGIFWCLRKGERITSRLKDLFNDVNKNVQKMFFIEIDGFDEFLLDMYNYVLSNNNPVSKASYEVKEKLSKLYETYSKVNKLADILKLIRQELHRLGISTKGKNSESVYISERQDISGKYENILKLLKENNYSDALEEINSNLEANYGLDSEILLHLKAECLYFLDRNSEALSILTDLISSTSRYNVSDYINACLCADNIDSKIEILDKGLTSVSQSTRLLACKAKVLISKESITLEGGLNAKKSRNEEIIELLKRGDDIARSVDNKCWKILFDYVLDIAKNDKDFSLCSCYVNYYFERVPYDVSVLKRKALLMYYEEKKGLKEISAFIDSYKLKDPDEEFEYDLIKIDIAVDLKDYNEIIEFCKKKYPTINNKIVIEKAKLVYHVLRNSAAAIQLLKKYLEKNLSTIVAQELVKLYLAQSDWESAEHLIQEYGLRKSEYTIEILEARGNYNALLDYYQEKIKAFPEDIDYIIGYSHTLLMLNRMQDAKDFANDYLVKIGAYDNILGINYYLAKQHLAGKITTEKTINELASSAPDGYIKAAACYMQGDGRGRKKGDEIIIDLLEKDYGGIEYLKHCFVFIKYLPSSELEERIVSKLKSINLSEQTINQIEQSIFGSK